MTNGQRVVTGYFLIAYVIPLLGNVLFSDEIQTIYQIFPLTTYTIVLLVLIYGLYMLMSRRPRVTGRLVAPRLHRAIGRMGVIYSRARPYFAAASLLLAWQYFASGMNSYRYAPEGESISDLGSFLLISVNVINVVGTVDLLYGAMNRSVGMSDRWTYIGTILLGAALVVSANGTASMFLALFFMFYATFPTLAHKLVFYRRLDSSVVGILKGSLAMVLVVVLVLGAWVVGEGIKASSLRMVSAVDAASDVAEQMLTEEGFWSAYPYYFLSTNSIYYYSLLFTANNSRESFNYTGVSPVVLPLKTLLFRLDYLVGRPFEVERPEPGTMSRVNYLLVTALPPPQQNPRAGSSPGLVAAFVYAFPFPLSVVFAAAYLLVVSRTLDRFINPSSTDRLTPIGVFVAVASLHGLFQSPFDMLAGFDPSTLFAVLIVASAAANAVPHVTTTERAAPSRRLWSDAPSPRGNVAARGLN